jgi:hypothetical protein
MGKQTTPAPSVSELRQEARVVLDRIKVTADGEDKRLLAVRAFELVQLAEQLVLDEQQRQGCLKRRKVESS